MENQRIDESMCEKISLSIKKSHKISIYSKKNTKSPKKYDLPQKLGKTNDAFEVIAGNSVSEKIIRINNIDLMSRGNSSGSHSNEIQQQRVMLQKSVTQYNNVQKNQAISNTDKSNHSRQLFIQTQQLPLLNMKKPISYTQQNSIRFYQNTQNISQLIDKQTESQINNLSIMDAQLIIANNRNKQDKQIVTGNLIGKKVLASQQQQSQQAQVMMENVMKLMNQQIAVAKENYSRRFQQVIADNARVIADLQKKLRENAVLLRQKNSEIQKIKQIAQRERQNYIEKSNSPLSQSSNKQKQVSLTKSSPQSQSYYQKRIFDLSQRLRIVQSDMSSNKSPLINEKIEILERGLLNYGINKMKSLSFQLDSFIGKSAEKMVLLSQSIQKLTIFIKDQFSQKQDTNLNQNRLKQIQTKIQFLKKQLNSFITKEFLYQNYTIDQLKEKFNLLKQEIVRCQLLKQEWLNVVKEYNGRMIMTDDSGKLKNKITLSNAHETLSKYTLSNNPNISKISISQLSNTHQFSHLIQKVAHDQQFINLGNGSSQSSISMSFTDQASQSLTQQHFHNQLQGQFKKLSESKQRSQHQQLQDRNSQNSLKYQNSQNSQKYQNSLKYQNSQEYKNCQEHKKNEQITKHEQQTSTAKWKQTVTSDMKQTCQGSIPSTTISRYYLPYGKNTINQIINNKQDSTIQRIKNLNELKMQSSQRIYSNNISRMISSTNNNTENTIINHQLQYKYYKNDTITNRQQQLQHGCLQLYQERQILLSQQHNKNSNKNNRIGQNCNHQQLKHQNQQPILNNTSYLSVSQMEDFNSVNLITKRQSSDLSGWSDDQFFYPGLQKQQQQSKVNQYNWQLNSPNHSNNSPTKSLEHLQQQFYENIPNDNHTMKKRIVSSGQSVAYHVQNKVIRIDSKNNGKNISGNGNRFYMQNSSLDYETFSDEQDQKQQQIDISSPITNSPFYTHKISSPPMQKPPLALNYHKPPVTKIAQQQKFSTNQQRLVSQLNNLQSSELPIKMIYDKKKQQGMIRMGLPNHPLNGKTFLLQKRELQKLEKLGLVVVKTYV